MTWHWLLATVLGFLICSCAPGDAGNVIQAASDVRTIDQCTKFQAAKNVVHARLKDLPTSDLHRLSIINRDGRAICTLDLDELIAELEAMAERLP